MLRLPKTGDVARRTRGIRYAIASEEPPLNYMLSARKMFALFFAFVVLGIAASSATAACSEAKVKRLAEQGKTVTSIARTCDMDKDEVKELIDSDDSDPDPDLRDTSRSGQGLPPGTPLAACGCYGGVSPQHREPNTACRSGFARPRACSQVCYGGGFAWQGVCE